MHGGDLFVELYDRDLETETLLVIDVRQGFELVGRGLGRSHQFWLAPSH